MNEWTAHISRTKKVGTRISLEMMTATVDAESENEARAALAEEMEDWSVDQISRTPAQPDREAGES